MPAKLIVGGTAVLREGVHHDRLPADLEGEIAHVTGLRDRDGAGYVDLLFPKRKLRLLDLPAECFEAPTIGGVN